MIWKLKLRSLEELHRLISFLVSSENVLQEEQRVTAKGGTPVDPGTDYIRPKTFLADLISIERKAETGSLPAYAVAVEIKEYPEPKNDPETREIHLKLVAFFEACTFPNPKGSPRG